MKRKKMVKISDEEWILTRQMLRLLEEMAGTVYGEHCNEHVLKSLVGELHDSLDDKYDGDDCGDDDDDLEDGDHFSMQGSVGEPPG